MGLKLLKKHFFKKNIYFFFIFLITLILFIKNFKNETYLTGWDNLQTELNPGLAIKRAFFSVWEEYQSLGLVAGMAHASDLVRACFLWVVSFILPQNIIRYFYHFLMLLLGGIGAMSLMKLMGFSEPFAFLGSLFYMLNLGTIQIFYLPFESFSTFFAFLPWGLWIFIKFATSTGSINKDRKIFWQFLLINILGTPSFYTQQLFIVYLLAILLFFIGYLVTKPKDLMFIIQKLSIIFLLIFIINSFWLLPQIYFLKTSSHFIYESKNNQLATEDVYYQNKEKGTLPYFLKLEGFYFDLFDKNNQYLFLFWKNHLQRYLFLQYFFIFLFFLGLFNALRKKDFRFIFLLIIITIALLNATWPINLLDNLIRKNKFISQIFRSPFTKFIIPYSFLYSYFVVSGMELIFDFINSFKNGNFLKFFKINELQLRLIIFIFISGLIILYSLPSFQGFFISPEMKVKIPDDYFQLMDYFKNQNKNKRIALFPEYTFWGWFHHRWGYNGSGFLWYGIEQPIVSRTFDVWSEKSESYFWEIKTALEAENVILLEKVLEKYQIDYIILDYSLLPIVGSMKGLQYDRLEKIINESKNIFLIKKWKNLALYQVKQKQEIDNFILFSNSLTNIGPKIKLTDKDIAYTEIGNYYTNTNQSSIVFPFLDLTTLTRLKSRNWEIVEKNNQFIIKTQFDFNLSDYQLISFDNKYQALLYQDEKITTHSVTLQFPQIFSHRLEIGFDKKLLKKITLQDFSLKKIFCFKNVKCFNVSFYELPQKYAYFIKIKNKNYSGRRLFFYILDQTKKQTLIEERLTKDVEYFILPPKYQFGQGYSINFQENSYKNLESKNDLISIEVYLFPYENLKDIRLINSILYQKDKYLQNNYLQNKKFIKTKKINYFTYEITIDKNLEKPLSNSFFILFQSFDPGWVAYQVKNSSSRIINFFNHSFPFFFGKKLKNHVLVNNWANGWMLDDTKVNNQSNIIIVFWPQYLEFLGLAILIFSFFFVILRKDNL